MHTRFLATCCIVAWTLALSSPVEAGQAAQKKCDELRISAADDERAAANDGRWNRTSTGPVFRAALINARAHKRIEAQCAAEGRTADAADARRDAEAVVVDNFALFVEFLGYRQALSDLEEKRFDKQVGGGAGGSGTTSIGVKSSVPSLIGLAIENGALLQTVSGTTITLRANPMNLVSALANKGYLQSAPDPVPGTFSSVLSDLSFAASFDSDRGPTPGVFTADKSQLTGFSIHYQILNWRDPRNVRYARAWEQARTGDGAILAARLNSLASLLRTREDQPGLPRPTADTLQDFDNWRVETSRRIGEATIDDLEAIFTEQAEAFRVIAERSPAVMTAVAEAGHALVDYFVNRNSQIAGITKSWVVAFDFNQIRQSQVGASAALPADVPAPGLPDLSTFTLAFGKGFSDGPEFTGNVAATLFTKKPEGSIDADLRDIQASVQLDVPLPRLTNIGGMVLTFGGIFESLKALPLGRPVVVNGKELTKTGNIWLLQSKLTVPAGSSGVDVPISLTWSNRTELVDEDRLVTRLNIGMTFDLDKLFARP